MKIKEMNISARAKACLLRAGYEEVSELKDVPVSALGQIRNMNQSCVNEVVSFINDYKFSESNDVIKRTGESDIVIHPTIGGVSVVTPKESNNDLLHRSIQSLHLSLRTLDCLHRAGIYTIEKLCSFSEYDLRSIYYLGYFNRREIIDALEEAGLSLRKDDLNEDSMC